MAAIGTLVKPGVSELQGAVDELQTAVQRVATCVEAADAADLGQGLIQIREVGIDPLEAAFANGLRRFDKSAEYKADGALSAVAWVRERCNLSAGAAAERVSVARQLETLPQIAKAFAFGEGPGGKSFGRVSEPGLRVSPGGRDRLSLPHPGCARWRRHGPGVPS